MNKQLEGASFAELIAEMISRLGDDPSREGMIRTPDRVKKSMEFLFYLTVSF